MKFIILKLINFYQKHITIYTSKKCKFYPTCSEYTKQAIIKYGVIKGSFLRSKTIIKM